MRFFYTPQFKKSLAGFTPEIRKKFYKQARFLLKDLRHPSLHAKKYNETDDIWQARVDKNVRFYFLIKSDVYILLDIVHHPK